MEKRPTSRRTAVMKTKTENDDNDDDADDYDDDDASRLEIASHGQSRLHY